MYSQGTKDTKIIHNVYLLKPENPHLSMSNGERDNPPNILAGRFPPKELQIMNKKQRAGHNVLPFIWIYFLHLILY